MSVFVNIQLIILHHTIATVLVDGLVLFNLRCSFIFIIGFLFLTFNNIYAMVLLIKSNFIIFLKGVLMKSLTTMSQSKELISTKEEDTDLIDLSFDKDRFSVSNPSVMKGLYNAIKEGSDMVIGGYFENKARVLLMQDDYLFVAVIDKDSHTHITRKGFKKQKKWNWEKVRETIQTVENKSNDELFKDENVKITVFRLEDLVGKDELPIFDIPFANDLDDADFHNVIESKLKMESYRVFLEIEKLLKQADPADNFYEDLKLNYDKTQEAYYKAAMEYLTELHRFQKEFRQQKHLKVLSLVQDFEEQ